MNRCTCGYETTDRSNYRRHVRTCRLTLKQKYDSALSSLRIAEQTIAKGNRDLTASRLENDRLKTAIRALQSRSLLRDCNICIVNNLYPYSQEPCVVSPAMVQQLLLQPSESVPRFVELKHFTGPIHSRNIHLPNRRGNTVQVVEQHNGGLRWMHRDRKTVVDELFERHLDELRVRYAAEQVCVWREWYRTEGLGDLHARDTVSWKEQLTKVDLILMNNQKSLTEARGDIAPAGYVESADGKHAI